SHSELPSTHSTACFPPRRCCGPPKGGVTLLNEAETMSALRDCCWPQALRVNGSLPKKLQTRKAPWKNSSNCVGRQREGEQHEKHSLGTDYRRWLFSRTCALCHCDTGICAWRARHSELHRAARRVHCQYCRGNLGRPEISWAPHPAWNPRRCG